MASLGSLSILSGGGSVSCDLPLTLQAYAHITLGSDVTVSSTSIFSLSYLLISADTAGTGTGVFQCATSTSWAIDASASSVEISTGDLTLGCSLTLASSQTLFALESSLTGGGVMVIGGTDPADTSLHISAAEISRLSIPGSITIGGPNTQSITVDGVTLGSGASSLTLAADESGTGVNGVVFSGSASSLAASTVTGLCSRWHSYQRCAELYKHPQPLCRC